MDGDYSHEIKRCLLIGRKDMTNLDSILESRDSTLPTKVCLVKAMVFLVIIYGCKSLTIKKAEHQRIYLQGSNGETGIENRLMDTGRGKERVRWMERVTWKLTLPYVKLIANGNLLYGSENSNGLYINLEVWDGEGDGREVHKGGDICMPMADSR